MKRFANRTTAGQALAEKLRPYANERTVILGVPRGGVPVAFEVAKTLNCPLDILAVKKIGAPAQPELAVGAISEDGIPYFNDSLVQNLSLEKSSLQKAAQKKLQELREQTGKLRGSRPALDLRDRDVIVIDDGIATGATLTAAIPVLRQRGVDKIILAAPVGAKDSLDSLRNLVDEVVTLISSENLVAVGMWYDSFIQVEDTEVLRLLAESQALTSSHYLEIVLRQGDLELRGDWTRAKGERGLIVFAHGSGSSRKSPRNRFVAQELNKAGFSTLLFDLLTEKESAERQRVFDIDLLTQRLLLATEEILKHYESNPPALGYFGASTGAAATLSATAQSRHPILAVVSRGGRPDLAERFLSQVTSPVLLIVGAEDRAVLDLNRKAQAQLSACRLVTIPGATHLFEEPGALEEVVEYAIQWFSEHIQSKKKLPLPQEQTVVELKKIAHPIRDAHSWDELIQTLAKSRIVMLGECTHGTEEFYRLRRSISERLIREHGFNFVAVEGDWPDFQKLNNYIRYGNRESARKILAQVERWPTWMWANEETALFVEWLKNFGVNIYGLDVYSLFESLDHLKEFSHRLPPETTNTMHRLFGCFESFKKNEKAYIRHLIKGDKGCHEEAISHLRHLLRLRMEDISANHRALFNAQQNARIVAHAEEYYRAMISGGPDSWNIRDRHMIETLDLLLKQEGPNSKCIVWAHNSHIGDYRATEMAAEGYVNLGGLAREKFGNEHIALVGFGSYEGQVLAGSAWDAPAARMPLPPARPASWEASCHKVALEIKAPQFYAIFDSDAKSGPLGSREYGHRAVGVVFQPGFEEHGRNYLRTIPAQRYDAFVFVDKTSALIPIPTRTSERNLPETWPGGV